MNKRTVSDLAHMLDTAGKAVEKTGSISRTEYDEGENLRLAFAHLVQIVGKAARRVSPEAQQAHPEIPWSNIIGMRHRVVHDYHRRG